MKIRWKILIILLTFSLTPLLVLRTHGLNSLTNLGNDLQAQTRITLLERATENLSEVAKSRAALINLEDRLYRTTLKSLQAETEIRLNKSAKTAEKQKQPSYFITSPNISIDKSKLVAHPDYKKIAMLGMKSKRKNMSHMAGIQRGDLIDLPVSPDSMSFWLSGNLSMKEAMPDITKLAPLLYTFKSCSKTLKKLALWQNVALENGLMATYPGHDSFPMGYDPRESNWYKEVKETKESSWTLPAPDPASRILCYRFSAPLFDAYDNFIGATSLVIPVDATINGSIFASPQPGTSVMMVAYQKGKSPEKSLLIVREIGDGNKKDKTQAVQRKRRYWQAPPKPEWLFEENPEFRTLIKDVTDKNSGVIQMDFKKIPSLWTYSPINSSLSLLIITPVTDFTAEAYEAEQYVHESIANQLEETSLIVVAAILIIAIVAFIVSRSLSKPISKLSEAVIKIGEGDWDARADFHSQDELGELAQNFNNMVPQLREHSANKQALNLADEAQQSLFPQSTPEIIGAKIGARCTFSEKTGGDYYDFVGCSTCGPEVFATAIGDVSGHGVSAALLMTSARAYIRALTGRGKPLVETIKDVNRLVTKDCMQTGHFMTMFTAICDVRNMRINWIRAGHDPALIYTPETDLFEELRGTGMALGVDENYQYEESITPVKSGQILILYTDGIWEAHSPAGKQFGKDQMRQVIRDHYHKDPQDIVDMLIGEIYDHRKGLPLEDDCTAIVIKFL